MASLRRVKVQQAEKLIRAQNHGVDEIDRDREQGPENGREKEPADDLAHRVGFKEGARSVMMRLRRSRRAVSERH